MKLTCLLGSGVSIPAGIPTVGDITNAVLSGDGIIDRTDGVSDEKQEDGRKRLILLAWLKAQAASRYSEIPERSVNYEDLAYLAVQIADDIGYEYENPAIHPFVCKALAELEGMFRNATSSNARGQLEALANSTVTYIRQTVVSQLLKQPTKDDLGYLRFFANACRDVSVTEVNLFTLNHDTLLEDFLREELNRDQIKVTDGLRTTVCDGSRRWYPRDYDESPYVSKLVKVFKLHGSFNWAVWDVKFGPSNCSVSRENTDRDGCFIGHYSPEFPPRDGPRSGPLFLIGTFNKMLKYHSGIFLELHHRFHRALEDEECRALIVCGYGFSDKGVNTRIVEWRRRSRENRLLIIDPAESTNIHEKARGAIQGEIEAIIDTQASHCGPVKHLKKGIGKRPDEKIEGVTWEEIKRRMEGTDPEFLADC